MAVVHQNRSEEFREKAEQELNALASLTPDSPRFEFDKTVHQTAALVFSNMALLETIKQLNGDMLIYRR